MALVRYLRRLIGGKNKKPEAPDEAAPASPFVILGDLPDTATDPSEEEIEAFDRRPSLPWHRI